MMRRLRAGVITVALAALASRAEAQSVVARVGGELAGTPGSLLTVPLTVDMTGAPGRALGGYRARLQWDPAILQYYGQAPAAGFAQPLERGDSISYGVLTFTAIQPAGATGDVLIAVPHFMVLDTTVSPISLTFQDLTSSGASTTPFEDLIPMLSVVNGTYCPAIGKWGDVDSDGRADSRDALAALSSVVGLPLGNGMTGALADVDGDNAVTSRDALVILSYAVGLPVAGFRVLLNAAGASCTTGSATTLTVLPDTIDLVPGQDVLVNANARDAQGRAVPLSNLTWRALDGAIAQVSAQVGYVQVTGFGPGVGRIVATLGPGVADTLIVKVAVRRTWITDIQKAINAPVQTGSARHPFASIDAAMSNAISGDTILVRPGTYPELFNQDVDVVLLGDSINRPVIDPRGYQYYSPGSSNYLTPGSGRVEVAHLVIRAAALYVAAHDMVVRNVLFDSSTYNYRALELYGDGNGGGDLRASAPGVRPAPRSASQLNSGSTANVHDVQVTGRTTYSQAIYIRYTDTVRVANVVTLADSSYYGSCYPGSNAVIEVYYAVDAWVHDNDVTGGECTGVSVQNDAYAPNQARLERNRIRRLAGTGIAVGGRSIRLAHNVISDQRNAYPSSEKAGIRILPGESVDSVHSVGDSIINVSGAGLHVDSARALVVESLTVDGAGLDTTYAYEGSFLPAGIAVLSSGTKIVLRHNRITNVQGAYNAAYGVGIVLGGWATRVDSRHNRISGTTGDAYAIYRSCYYYSCGGADTTAADSVVSVGDTITGGLGAGLAIQRVRSATIDSLFVSTTTYGFFSSQSHRVRVRRSHARNAAIGMYVAFADSVESRGNRTVADSVGTSLQFNTIASVHGLAADSNFLGGLENTATNLFVDSSLIARNGVIGYFAQAGAGANIRRTRFEDNVVGIVFQAAAESLTVRQSSFISNDSGAVENGWGAARTVFADSNYWGSNLGPSCQATSGTCNPGAGDSVLTPGVDFSNFLTLAPVTGAPPVRGGVRPVAFARSSVTTLLKNPVSLRRPRPAAAPPRVAEVPRAEPVRPARRPVVRHPRQRVP